MATIKSFTDISQSKKLAEILPLESADMRIGNYVGKSGKVDGTNVHYYPKGESFGAPEIIDAWSLSALLEVLPIIDLYAPSLKMKLTHKYYVEVYLHEQKRYLTTDDYDNPVDACVTMIEKLHELKML